MDSETSFQFTEGNMDVIHHPVELTTSTTTSHVSINENPTVHNLPSTVVQETKQKHLPEAVKKATPVTLYVPPFRTNPTQKLIGSVVHERNQRTIRASLMSLTSIPPELHSAQSIRTHNLPSHMHLALLNDFHFSKGQLDKPQPDSSEARKSLYSVYQKKIPKDNFQRVCFDSHYRDYSKKKPYAADDFGQQTRNEKPIFGETDYLKNKLGFTMPPVEQTLATVQQRRECSKKEFGMRNLSEQRLMTISNLLRERTLHPTHREISHNHLKKSGYKKTPANNMPAIRNLKITEAEKKPPCANAQYISCLYAKERRLKHQSLRANFALSRETAKIESQLKYIESETSGDQDALVVAKKAIEKEKMRAMRGEGREGAAQIAATESGSKTKWVQQRFLREHHLCYRRVFVSNP